MKKVDVYVGMFLLLAPSALTADEVQIGPSKDNTLYEDIFGEVSNGAGEHLFAGHTNYLTTDANRRGLIAFDLTDDIPAGSTILSATLTLHLSRFSPESGGESVSIHRVLTDWGEGTSDALFEEGGGAPATEGDATWIHTFFDTSFWANEGGDFVAAASASRLVLNTIQSYTWGPTTAMRDDVQGWLDDPGSNFGWLLLGVENAPLTAKRFDTKENLTVGFRPVLTVAFTPPAAAAGRVPDGNEVSGTPLTIEHANGGRITLSWGDSCLASDDDFAIYEGTLGDFYSHTMFLCSTGGATSWTIDPGPGSTYYLVVPRNASREGSYGSDSAGTPRPPGASACLPQEIGACP